jgi:hypothetical protein
MSATPPRYNIAERPDELVAQEPAEVATLTRQLQRDARQAWLLWLLTGPAGVHRLYFGQRAAAAAIGLSSAAGVLTCWRTSGRKRWIAPGAALIIWGAEALAMRRLIRADRLIAADQALRQVAAERDAQWLASQ